MTALRGKRGEGGSQGEVETSCQRQRQQSGWETDPSITLPVFQRQPRHALLSPYEANCKWLKLGVRSPLSLFPYALQYIALQHPPSHPYPPPPASTSHTSHPQPPWSLPTLLTSAWADMHYRWAFCWKPVTLHVSSAWLSTGEGRGGGRLWGQQCVCWWKQVKVRWTVRLLNNAWREIVPQTTTFYFL